MSYKINNSELYHYGVLGMKWGVRKDKDRAARREAVNKVYVERSKLLDRNLDKLSGGKHSEHDKKYGAIDDKIVNGELTTFRGEPNTVYKLDKNGRTYSRAGSKTQKLYKEAIESSRKLAALDKQNYKKAQKMTNSYLTSKYGNRLCQICAKWILQRERHSLVV